MSTRTENLFLAASELIGEVHKLGYDILFLPDNVNPTDNFKGTIIIRWKDTLEEICIKLQQAVDDGPNYIGLLERQYRRKIEKIK